MKNKTFFLLFALMLGFATVNAQSDEKYEYAIVEYFEKTVTITTSDGQFEERKISEKSAVFSKKIEFLKIIKEMNDKGWDVINTDFHESVGNIPNYYMYHMQKKRTN